MNQNKINFISDNHIRYNNGVKSDANNKGTYRDILIESCDNETFMVSIHNLSTSENNIQMYPKPMKIVREDNDIIELRGYGYDEVGSPFSDYGIILHLSNDNIEKITLKMWDRNVSIEYLKADIDIKAMWVEEIESIKSFQNKWNRLNIQEQMTIAYVTDQNNNIGHKYFLDGKIDTAITYFLKALEIMPTNDDALHNLITCYKKNSEYKNIPILWAKLYVVVPSNRIKEKIIAFSLMTLLIENYEDEYDMGIVGLSELLEYIRNHYNIFASEEELDNICDKINQPWNSDILTYSFVPKTHMSSPCEKKYRTEENVPLSIAMEARQAIFNW